MNAYRLLADAVLLLHLAFILFVVAGALPAMRWRALVPLHLAAAAWGVAVEAAGLACPLTAVENRLRLLAGAGAYQGDCIGHYLPALIYPDGLTRAIQWALAGLVLALNAWLYARMLRRRKPASTLPRHRGTAGR